MFKEGITMVMVVKYIMLWWAEITHLKRNPKLPDGVTIHCIYMYCLLYSIDILHTQKKNGRQKHHHKLHYMLPEVTLKTICSHNVLISVFSIVCNVMKLDRSRKLRLFTIADRMMLSLFSTSLKCTVLLNNFSHDIRLLSLQGVAFRRLGEV